MSVVHKQPWEVYPIAVDFSATPLDDGETLSLAGCAVVAHDKWSGADVSSDVVDASTIAVVDSTALQITLKATSGRGDYVLSFRATTSAGRLFEENLGLQVRD